MLTDGLRAVEAACAEALGDGVHSADVVLDILARRREPGPLLTITTPDALRLGQEPAADGAQLTTASGATSDGAYRDPGRPAQVS